jgi:flavorubredoxin
MDKVMLKDGIHWVGAIDWNLTNFHGYLTQRGSTYNAYLIQDEKTVLIDTVKAPLFDEMWTRVKELIDPSKIDIVVSNHVEMDHSGALPRVMEELPKAKVITSPQGEKGLKRHFKKDYDFQVVKTGDSIKIGKRTLHFFLTPMVHWPDNMVTYCPEEKILFSNDAFGQHIASTERFDDQCGWDILREEAGKYWANIVMPYADQVQTALKALGGLDIKLIAPSHGVMWRGMIPKILGEYQKWSTNTTEPDRALIVYDTMWGSTERMAMALRDGLLSAGANVTVRNLKHKDISDIMTDLLTSRMVLLGSPTLNNGMLPSMGAFLTYIKGLKPKNRIGFAFGSYGWGGQSVGEMEEVMKGLGWEIPLEGAKLKYIPDDKELDDVKAIGRKLGERLKGGR